MPDNGKSANPGALRSIYRFFRSVKVAVALLLIITSLSILATLIPQGKDTAYYQAAYGTAVAWLITELHFDRFFRSFLFLMPSALFLVSLAVCAIDRFAGRIRRKMKNRFGPDILHIGLLILVVGGVVTFSVRKEGFVTLSQGDTVSIPGGYSVSLLSFEFLTYENGMPKDWISTVSVSKDGRIEIEEFQIEVNRPLKIGNMKLYQSSYFIESTLSIRDAGGALYEIEADSVIPAEAGAFIFRGIESTSEKNTVAVLDTWLDHEITGTVRLAPGEGLAGYTIAGMDQGFSTGIQAVIDPGYKIVFVALFVVLIGLSVTYIQKIGDNR